MRSIPWQLKLVIKLLLGNLPVSYSAWRSIGIFRHGQMDSSQYAKSVYDYHLSCSQLDTRSIPLRVLELGPGDSLMSAIFAAQCGGSCTLIDVGAYANTSVSLYTDLLKGCSPEVQNVVSNASNFLDVLPVLEAEYLTEGLVSMRQVKDASKDFIFSQAVLEHFRADEVSIYVDEIRRVISASGVASHRVDFSDHLGGGSNSLRFSDKFWQSGALARTGIYTNRMSPAQMKSIFESNRFNVEIVDVTKRPASASLRREFLHRDCSGWTEEDLTITGYTLVARPV